MRDQCLLPELGASSDVADAIVFLCSDRARYITGQLQSVDGGVSAHVQHLADVRRLGGSVIAPTAATTRGSSNSD
jgi:NAD(P)-dependent dehydrogenase (short-subunit alcohol dehydrogenase family)